MAGRIAGANASPLAAVRQGPGPEAPTGSPGLLGSVHGHPGICGGGTVTICESIPRPRVDLLYGGYTITQRIRWLNKREEIRAQLEREFAELQLGDKERS